MNFNFMLILTKKKMSLSLHLDSRFRSNNILDDDNQITNSPANYQIEIGKTLNNNIDLKTVFFPDPCKQHPNILTYIVELAELTTPNVNIEVPQPTGAPMILPIAEAFPYYYVEFWTGKYRREQAMINPNQNAIRATFVIYFDKITPDTSWILWKSKMSSITRLDFINSETIRFRIFTVNGDTVAISDGNGIENNPYLPSKQTSALINIRPNITNTN